MADETFTLKQIADRLGTSNRWLRGEVAAGRLRASRLTSGGWSRFEVGRAELVRWLLASGFPLAEFRLLHAGGVLYLLGGPPGLQPALTRAKTRALATPTDLGLALARPAPCWGAVIDLAAWPAAPAALAGYAARADRPVLVGLYPDPADPAAARAFDVLLPLAAGPTALAASIHRLRPGLRASDRV